MTRKKRNVTIDILRVIGLVLVIAAHCEFPEWFYELREFDVVTLVAVSGMSFYVSSGRSDESYGSYVKKRFLRLVVPVWIFLALFFIFFRLLGRSFSLSVILESFALLSGGILFIWVYRIFFINALLNPLLRKLTENYGFRISSAVLICGLAVSQLLYRFVSPLLPGAAGKLFEYIVLYTLGYAMISLAGMLWEKGEKRERMILLGAFAAVFAGSLLIGGFRTISSAKYPPQLYYISYGLLVTFGLYLLFERIPVSEKAGRVITWLSVNTMRIYMWHIFLFYLLDTVFPELMKNAWLTYAVLLGGGVIGAWIQGKLPGINKRR